MLKEKVIQGRLTLEDIKPFIERNTICFPLSVAHEYIQEDGRSFGYPVDDGFVTIVKYDFVMGALAEDTIQSFSSLKKPRSPSCGIAAIDTYEWSSEQLNTWKIGLDASWAEDEFNQWQAARRVGYSIWFY